MSTITQLEHFRNQFLAAQPPRVVPKNRFSELWGDGLASVAVVALALILVFEVIQFVMP